MATPQTQKSSGFAPRLTATPLDPGVERVGLVVSQLSRTHYFDGRLLTAADLVRDQTWLDARLREVGRAQGDGVVRGLEVALVGTSIQVAPGVAVTPLGRVLELDTPLAVDLGDRARMQLVNGGKRVALETGLHAVVLRYAEHEAGLAEVFPAELGKERTSQSDRVVESVEVVLVKLPEALPDRRDGPSARAALAAPLFAKSSRTPGLEDDGVVLGVLAARGDAPRWLDGELLRHPLRVPGDPAAYAQDLARHWAALFPELRATRPTAGAGSGFAAADFVEFLPAAGPAPKGAFDPVAGVQRFFPAHFDVAITPVRSDELALLLEESRDLAPLDVSRPIPANVLVAARLPPTTFALLAPALERRDGKPDETELRKRQFDRIEPLRLRFARPQIHALDTDASAWREIWSAIGESDLYYVRRPARATTVGVSGLVLARGSAPPPPPPASTGTGTGTGPIVGPGRISLTDLRVVGDVFGVATSRLVVPIDLRAVEVKPPTVATTTATTTTATTTTTTATTTSRSSSVESLDRFATIRKPTTPEGEKSVAELTKLLESDEKSAARLSDLFAQLGREHDTALWPTLEELVRNDRLPEFSDRLAKVGRAPSATDVALITKTMNLSRTTQKLWA